MTNFLKIKFDIMIDLLMHAYDEFFKNKFNFMIDLLMHAYDEFFKNKFNIYHTNDRIFKNKI